MGSRKRFTITEDKKMVKKLYQALLESNEENVEDCLNCLMGKKTAPIAVQMSCIHLGQGMRGVNTFIKDLRKCDDPELKCLAKFILSDSDEIENDAGTLLSDVQPQQMPWLWYPRLALGKITMLDGDPGLGKSLIGADIGARVTRGEKMPDGTPCLATGGVVVIMPEDALQDTILPRFARAGADLSKVVDLSTVNVDDDDDNNRDYYDNKARHMDEYEEDSDEDYYTDVDRDIGEENINRNYSDKEGEEVEEEEEVQVQMEEEEEGEAARRPFQLQSDLDYLEAAIRRVDAKLVYIDPVMALAGSANMYKDDDVRTLLLPLKTLVEELQVACVLVRHMTKTRTENPLMAGNGSVAFIGLARTGLMVTQHPQDKSQVILSHIKSNIGPLAPAITYTVCSDEASGDDRPYIVWGNELQASELDQIMAPRKTNRK